MFQKLRWFLARGVDGSQIPVTTRGFQLGKSRIQCSYLTHQAIWPNVSHGMELPNPPGQMPSGLCNGIAYNGFAVRTLLQ